MPPPSLPELFFEPLLAALRQAKTCMLTVHVGPDGDALGSMLALQHGLAIRFPSLQIDCLMDGTPPKIYEFLPGIETVRDAHTATGLPQPYDVAICVDCGSLDRLGTVASTFSVATTSVNMDHHISNEQFADINLVVTDAAASGQVVADFLAVAGVPLNVAMAANVYTALVTDTGGFKYSNATAATYEWAARCLKTGMDHEKIYKAIYENRPRAQVMLLANAVMNAQFNTAQTLCWTEIPTTLLTRHGALEEHTDGIIDVMRQIDTVLVAAVFKAGATPGETRVSFRSDHHGLDVAAVAGQFGGGGHKMASGCTIEHPMVAARDLVLPILEVLVLSVSAEC